MKNALTKNLARHRAATGITGIIGFGGGVCGPAPGAVDRVSSFMKNAHTKNQDWKVLSPPLAQATNPSLLTKLSTRRRAAIGIGGIELNRPTRWREAGNPARGARRFAVRVSSAMKNALTKNLARRRAASGITEESDCLALVVSEETGRISMTESGGAVDRVSSFMKNALTKNLGWKVLSLPRAHATNPSLLTKLSTRRRAVIGIGGIELNVPLDRVKQAIRRAVRGVSQSGFHLP